MYCIGEQHQRHIKNFTRQMLDWVLNTLLSSERLIQECETYHDKFTIFNDLTLSFIFKYSGNF